jgi:hypothetical protein
MEPLGGGMNMAQQQAEHSINPSEEVLQLG